MAITLLGAHNIFSILQHVLSSSHNTNCIALKREVYDILNDFQWLHHNIYYCSTKIAKLMPLILSVLDYNDASGTSAGGVWYSTLELYMRYRVTQGQPLLQRLEQLEDIMQNLVTDENPTCTITNSDLELAEGLLHQNIITQYYDIHEQTIVSKTNNLTTMFWQRKGSATTEKVPAYLLH